MQYSSTRSAAPVQYIVQFIKRAQLRENKQTSSLFPPTIYSTVLGWYPEAFPVSLT